MEQNKNISKNLTTNLSASLGKPKKGKILVFFVLLLLQLTAEHQVTPGSLFFLVGLLVELALSILILKEATWFLG